MIIPIVSIPASIAMVLLWASWTAPLAIIPGVRVSMESISIGITWNNNTPTRSS